MDPVAVYVHTPFCPSKCGYCDFNSFAMTGEIIDRTVKATVKELENGAQRGRPAKTIFLGGGTPTYLPTDGLLQIIEAVMKAHPPVPGCEITSEANPGTADAAKFRAMRGAGFNRLSIGAQSFDADDLIRLGRVHKQSDIANAVRLAREAGFVNVNLDLMFALPYQSSSGWQRNLEAAIALDPDHLSLYCLTIEPNTEFYKLNLKGELDRPVVELETAMYDRACDLATKAGYVQYEISNFSKPGMECRHNLCYWRSEEYVAYGPGAVERIGSERWTHIKHPVRYCEAVEFEEDLACEREVLDDQKLRLESVMLGLRLNEGIALNGVSEASIDSLVDRGWIARQDDLVRLTRKGRHYCNQAILELV